MYDILIVILAVIFVLGIAINIHEFGHFAVAKLLGMRVDAYSFFGLGPRIWGFKYGHTDYRISAIPLGRMSNFTAMKRPDRSKERTRRKKLFPIRNFTNCVRAGRNFS